MRKEFGWDFAENPTLYPLWNNVVSLVVVIVVVLLLIFINKLRSFCVWLFLYRFPIFLQYKIPNGNSKFCWEKEINFKEKGKDKPGRRRKEPRIRGSELSSRLPRLTPLSLSSSSSSSAIPATGRLYPRNQTPPSTTTAKLLLPKNEKKKKKSYNNQRSRTRLVLFPSLSLYSLSPLHARPILFTFTRPPSIYSFPTPLSPINFICKPFVVK